MGRNARKKAVGCPTGALRWDSGFGGRYMDGHPTDDDGREAAQEVHSPPEVGDLARMGINGGRNGCFTSSRDSSHDPVSIEETVRTKAADVRVFLRGIGVIFSPDRLLVEGLEGCEAFSY